MSTLTLEIAARRNNKPTIFELKGKKIKPCPFCGSDDICLVSEQTDDSGPPIDWCSCCNCGVEGPFSSGRYYAIRRWQNRC